jgi:hypothetical protein
MVLRVRARARNRRVLNRKTSRGRSLRAILTSQVACALGSGASASMMMYAAAGAPPIAPVCLPRTPDRISARAVHARQKAPMHHTCHTRTPHEHEPLLHPHHHQLKQHERPRPCSRRAHPPPPPPRRRRCAACGSGAAHAGSPGQRGRLGRGARRGRARDRPGGTRERWCVRLDWGNAERAWAAAAPPLTSPQKQRPTTKTSPSRPKPHQTHTHTHA